jgi:hypothetical protein
MPNPRMKDRRVVHKSTAGILTPIPEAVDLVGNPPPGLTTNTVALLLQRVTANRRSLSRDITRLEHARRLPGSVLGEGSALAGAGEQLRPARLIRPSIMQLKNWYRIVAKAPLQRGTPGAAPRSIRENAQAPRVGSVTPH